MEKDRLSSAGWGSPEDLDADPAAHGGIAASDSGLRTVRSQVAPRSSSCQVTHRGELHRLIPDEDWTSRDFARHARIPPALPVPRDSLEAAESRNCWVAMQAIGVTASSCSFALARWHSLGARSEDSSRGHVCTATHASSDENRGNPHSGAKKCSTNNTQDVARGNYIAILGGGSDGEGYVGRDAGSQGFCAVGKEMFSGLVA